MDEELKRRFLQQKLLDLLNDDSKPLPTIICEREQPHILELIRKYWLYSPKMIPFRVKNCLILVSEGLDRQKGSINYGELYIDVNIN